MVPFNIILTLYKDDGFLGKNYVIDGAKSNYKLGGEMQCINIKDQFGDRTTSMKIEHKKAVAAKGFWKNVGSATGAFSKEIDVGITSAQENLS